MGVPPNMFPAPLKARLAAVREGETKKYATIT
jgi:hypothetical protein